MLYNLVNIKNSFATWIFQDGSGRHKVSNESTTVFIKQYVLYMIGHSNKIMRDTRYFIAFAYENKQKETHFSNGVIKESPLKWLKEKQKVSPNVPMVTLLWWKELTEEEEKAADGIVEVAF